MLSLESSILVKLPTPVSLPSFPSLRLSERIGGYIPLFSGRLPKNPLSNFEVKAKLVPSVNQPHIYPKTVFPPQFVFPRLPPKTDIPPPSYPTPSYVSAPTISFPSVSVPSLSLTPPTVRVVPSQVPFVDVCPIIFDVPMPDLPKISPMIPNIDNLVKQVFINLFDLITFNKKLSLQFFDYELLAKKSQPDYLREIRKSDIQLANRRASSITSETMAALVGEKRRRVLRAISKWRQLEYESEERRVKLLLEMYENFIKQVRASYKSMAIQYALKLKSRVVNLKGLRAILKRNSIAIEVLQANTSLSGEAIDANESIIRAGEAINSLNSEAISLTERCITAANKILDLSNINNQILKDYLDGYLALVDASNESSRQNSYEAMILGIQERTSLAHHYSVGLEAHYLQEANSLYKDFLELESQIQGLNDKIQSFEQLVSSIRESYYVEDELLQTKAQNLAIKGELRIDDIRFGVIEKAASLKEKFSDMVQLIKQTLDKANLELKYLKYSLESAQAKGRAQSLLSKAEVDRTQMLANSQLEMAVLEVLGS